MKLKANLLLSVVLLSMMGVAFGHLPSAPPPSKPPMHLATRPVASQPPSFWTWIKQVIWGS